MPVFINHRVCGSNVRIRLWAGQTGFALSLENYSSLVTTDFVENSPHRDTSISGVSGVQRGPGSSGGLFKNCGSTGRRWDLDYVDYCILLATD